MTQSTIYENTEVDSLDSGRATNGNGAVPSEPSRNPVMALKALASRLMREVECLTEVHTVDINDGIDFYDEVSRFEIDLLDPVKGEWINEWTYTNRLPVLVRVTLGLGKLSGNSSTPQDLASRIIHLPAQNIIGLQGVRPGPLGPPPFPGFQGGFNR